MLLVAFTRMEEAGQQSTDLVEYSGWVRRSLANDLFEVELADGRQVLAHLSTGARLRAVRVGAGDRVRVELARYDRTRGRIIGRA